MSLLISRLKLKEALHIFIGNNFAGIVDYDSGPYSVMFTKGDTAAILCVNITDDQLLEEDEIFGLIIDAASLPVGVDICENLYTANVTILDNECT